MKSSRLLTFAFLVLAAQSLAAQVNDTYIIPVAGNVPGAFGTQWMTQFSVFNPQTAYALEVSVTFLPTGGGQGKEVLINVPANSVWFSDDALRDLFGLGGTGALLLATFPEDNPGVPNDVLSRAFLVTTNTFNNAKTGTYGQTIPGVWTGLQDFNTDGISAIAHGIRNLSSQGWRTNVGAVNLGRQSVTMRVTVFVAESSRLSLHLDDRPALRRSDLSVAHPPGQPEGALRQAGDAGPDIAPLARKADRHRVGQRRALHGDPPGRSEDACRSDR